ncbi:MAG: DegV family protein, partial [Bacilli bacterium]
MESFILFTDSCVDLPNKLAKELDLTVLPLTVNVEGKEYKNYLDEREIKTKDFYDMLREHKKTSTSQVNSTTFVDYIEPLLKEGKDVLVISFSSALSGTFNGAVTAAEELKELYKDRKVIV